MRVLVTGASGFVGRPLVAYLSAHGFEVRAASRGPIADAKAAVETVALPDLSRNFDATSLVEGCNAVVHLAGIAHSTTRIPEADYQAVNCDAAHTLALAARAAGVSRFVYVSSVRAQTGPSAIGALTEAGDAHPTDAYGRSKLAGERAVMDALAGSDTEPVILRPVLMYGPGCKGNMATLMRVARTNWPLPLGAMRARRSVLGIENFCSAVVHAIRERSCSGGTFLVADPVPVTAPQIVAAFRRGLAKPHGIFTIPVTGAGPLLTVLGRQNLAERLFADLVVSTGAFAATGWRAPVSTAQGLATAING